MRQRLLLSTIMIAVGIGAQAQNVSPFWSLSKNSNATVNSRLGTTNAIPLSLATNNTTRVYIDANGKLGFGTTAPASQFHVEGPTLLSIFVSTDPLSEMSGSGVIGYVKAQPTAAGQRLGYFLMGSRGGGTNPGNGAGMVAYADGAWSSTSHPSYMTFETAPSGDIQRAERMRINNIGYVGIGTSDPGHRLEVIEGNQFSSAIFGDGGSTGVIGVGGSTGLYGSTHNGAGFGVQGSGASGVYGSGTSNGVLGINTSTSTSNSTWYGVHGISTSATYGWGVFGEGTSVGVLGRSASIGMDAQSTGTGGIGIYAFASAGTGLSVSGGTGYYAGYFAGNVYTTGTYSSSDKKLKKNITAVTDAVAIINKLKPKSYEFITDGKFADMHLPTGQHYGLIAQDVESVLPNLIKETDMEMKPDDGTSPKAASKTKETFKAVNYTELIPILVKGMQEQDAEKKELEQRVQTLEQTVQELKALLINNANGSVSSAHLDVASPNPAKGNTTIGYTLPAASASAKLIVVNLAGQVVKEFSLAGAAGKINLNVSNLASGSYPCTLWVNGQATVTKQLVVAH